MPSIQQALSRFDLRELRPLQRPVIEAAAKGQDVLAVMPTGMGKSLCYQLPSLIEGGVHIVVSPLLALMRDQLSKLHKLGIDGFHISSAQDDEENHANIQKLRACGAGLFYLSPEQLAKSSTQLILQDLPLTRLIIDEAHCFSVWGHDFRPDYQAIPAFLRRHQTIRLSAFTATATARVVADIQSHLFEKRIAQEFIHSPRRDNITIKFKQKNRPRRQVLDAISDEPTIIYAARRNKTEVLAQALRAEGYRAKHYHAGLETQERRLIESEFLSGETPIIVATNAFGMGIDHSGIRQVIHADQPASIEAYVQEIGRAGRDGAAARSLCLYGEEDSDFRREQIQTSVRDPHERMRQLNLLHRFNELARNGGNWDDIDAYFLGAPEEEEILDTDLQTTPLLALKRWRYSRAQQAKVPVYFILPDDLLENIAEQQPSSLEAFGAISGIGEYRLQKYGTEIIELFGGKQQPLKRASRKAATKGEGALFLRLQETALTLRLGANRAEKPMDCPSKIIARIVETRPQTLQAMAQIPGMNNERLDRFGNAFLLELQPENR